MANFELVFSPVRFDVTGNAWVDPATALPNAHGGGSFAIPTRQNARSGLPHRYTRFLLGDVVTVQLHVLYSGSMTLLPDALLGGNLFQAWFVEVPHGMFTWNSVAGMSAQQWFEPVVVGAYCAMFSRANGGGILFHFMVE